MNKTTISINSIKIILAATIGIMSLTGCVTVGVGPYPAKESYTAHISNTTPPKGERAGSYHHIENSQVYIDSPSKFRNWSGLAAFIGFAIDGNRNEELASKLQENLTQSFELPVKELIHSKFSKSNLISITESNEADLRILPYVVIEVISQDTIKVKYNLEVRYNNGGNRKWYSITANEKFDFRSATASTSTSQLQKYSRDNFSKLLDILMQDLKGEIAIPSNYDEITSVFRRKGDNKSIYALLKSAPGGVIATLVYNEYHIGVSKVFVYLDDIQ